MKPDSTNTEIIVNQQGTFRRLKDDERVLRGDWIKDDQDELTPWSGPTGFQASSFEHTVYRPVTEEQNATETDQP